MPGAGSILPGIPFIPFPSSSVQVAAGGIPAAAIAAGAITAAKFAAGAIDANAIADNAIDAGAIAAGAITAAKFAANAIDASAIANGAIDAATFAANAVDATAFAQGAADKVWSTAARSLTDKAGFTLTAGSYSVRASNTQRGTGTITNSTTGTITISSVTTTRAMETYAGASHSATGTANMEDTRIAITAATTITGTRGDNSVSPTTTFGAVVEELF